MRVLNLAASIRCRRTKDENDRAALTVREAEVGQWLACGKTNQEIALLVRASPRTIDKHVEHILAKLRVENRTTAAIVLATIQSKFPR